MTSPIEVPPSVISAVRNRWPDVADDWAQQVMADFNGLCSRYRATPVQILPARFGFVAAVDTSCGPLVMRSTPDPAGWAQATVAQALAGYGVAPRVHEIFSTRASTWTIMDQIVPGVSLASSAPSTIRPEAITDMFRAIADRPAPLAVGIQKITDWLRQRLTEANGSDLPTGQSVAPAEDRRRALALLDTLVAADDINYLCHGDSHLGNILIGDAGQLLWIDPRGVTGEAGYDIAVFSLKASRYDIAGAQAMASHIAGLTGTEVDRAQSWVIIARAARV